MMAEEVRIPLARMPPDRKSAKLCKWCEWATFGRPSSASPVPPTLSEANANADRCITCRRAVDMVESFTNSQHVAGLEIRAAKARVTFGILNTRPNADPEKYESIADSFELRLQLVVSIVVGERPVTLSTKFQRCSPDPVHVDSFCTTPSLIDWNSGITHPNEARIRPVLANKKLFRKWKETCLHRHGTSCMTVDPDARSVALRFIDVEQRCIIEGGVGDKYVALSYMWGKSTSREDKLCGPTASRFFQPFSLSTDILSTTVDDAITLTGALGERYLWVDRLCILQDDNSDKARFLPHMHRIYGAAELTIIAEAGEDSDAGLPGIRPGTRNLPQKVVNLDDVPMMETLEPVSAIHEAKESSVIPVPRYSTRAWCFQERMLSFRALIFTPEQVYWECQKEVWCEEAFWECSAHKPTYYSSVKDSWQGSFYDLYDGLAKKYSERQLTNQSDSLDAFQGILQRLDRDFEQKFHSALPIQHFQRALSWGSDDTSLVRNEAKRFEMDSDGKLTLVPFPSWCWVGWTGRKSRIQGPIDNGRECKSRVFYRLHECGDLIELYPKMSKWPNRQWMTENFPEIGAHTSDEHGVSVKPWPTGRLWKKLWDVQIPLDTSIAHSFHLPQTSFTRDLVPEHVIGTPLGRTLLFFRTSCAVLEFQEKDASQWCILVQGDKSAPAIIDHVPSPEPGSYEFAIISTAKDSVTAMCLSWDNGVAYRIGLVSLMTKDWTQFEAVWKPVVLG